VSGRARKCQRRSPRINLSAPSCGYRTPSVSPDLVRDQNKKPARPLQGSYGRLHHLLHPDRVPKYDPRIFAFRQVGGPTHSCQATLATYMGQYSFWSALTDYG
jgi:hypothetical protein